MEPLSAAQFFCPRCSREVDAAAAVCPHCGAVLADAGVSAHRSPPPQRERRDLLDNPWIVLAMLFLATGALGLPFLWKSKGFSPFAKIVIGVVVTIYTFALIALAAAAVWWAWRSVQDSLATPR